MEKPMGTIRASMFMALDGVVDPMLGNWHFPYFNEEMGDAVTGTHDADVMLFGRVTYDSFAGAWPEREEAGEADAVMAKHLGDMRKVVVSRSKLSLDWRNSEQLEGDLVASVTALKGDPAIEHIALSGSVSVVRQLLDAGLLDELHLFVHPATAGSGLKLFADGEPPRHLQLISAQPFRTGVVYLVYRPDPDPPAGSYEDARETLPQE
jgi:dihydrofolate reductase